MPFTFCHPAIVLPLGASKQWFSMTGLVVGSMAPDFEYFLRLRVLAYWGHSWAGIFYFDLPIGLLACFLFHDVVRNPMVRHLPDFLRRRFGHLLSFDWNQHILQRWPIVCLSILIGAASHILWDGFTHRDGMFVHLYPILQTKVWLVGNKVPIFKILQHSCSLAGGLVIAGVVLAQTRREPSPAGAGLYWVYIVFGTPAFCLVRFRFRMGNIDEIIVTIIAGFLVALVGVSVIKKFSTDRVL